MSFSRSALLLVLSLATVACASQPAGTPPSTAPAAPSAAASGPAASAPEAEPAMAEPAARLELAEPVLLQVPEDPTISFNLWFKVGSQNDPPGKEGLAELTGSMLSEGATEANSYEEILERLYPMAASYNVSVDREMTSFRGRVHKDNLDAYLELFQDALLRPAFLPEDFERLKSSQLSSLETVLRYASDEELGKASLNYLVFRGTRYAHPELGTVEGLKSITLDDVKAFYRRHYTAENAVLGLGGGYTAETLGKVERALAALGPGEVEPPPAPEVEPIDAHRVLLVSKPNADASISFGFPIDVSRGEDDFYALWLANSWLGEHRNSSSHLYQVIREKRGLNYGDYSYIEEFPFGGFRQFPPTNVGRRQQLFQIWIRTLPNDKAHFALRAAVRELDDLVSGGMSEEEFELTRSFLRKYILHFAKSTGQRLGYAIDDVFYGVGGDGHLARFRDKLETLTREEVNRAVRRHLRSDRLYIAIVTGEAEALAEALASEAPSPIEYASEMPAEVVEEDEAIATYPLGIERQAIEILDVGEMFEK